MPEILKPPSRFFRYAPAPSKPLLSPCLGSPFNKDCHRRVSHYDLITVARELSNTKTLGYHSTLDRSSCLPTYRDFGHHVIEVDILRSGYGHQDLYSQRLKIFHPQDFDESAKAAPRNGIPYCSTCGFCDVFPVKVYASSNFHDKALRSHDFTPLSERI